VATGVLPGQVDYRLARKHVLEELKRGRLSRYDVCDAHPELVRAARCVGKQTAHACPVCDKTNLAYVSYAFGSRLPAGGRCITSGAELARLSRSIRDLVCYVVEVCPECSWNHLVRLFALAAARA